MPDHGSFLAQDYSTRRTIFTILKPCFTTCALAAAIVAAALGSSNPHPCLSFWRAAASAEQTPLFRLLFAQHADEQSALLVHPPVMNCAPPPAPTFLDPASLGVTTAVAVMATIEVRDWNGEMGWVPYESRG